MDLFRIKNFEIRNRLFVGTGKYASYELMQQALDASGCQVVTVAVRRERLVDQQGRSLLEFLDLDKYVILPNTAGCFTAEDAIRVSLLGRDLLEKNGNRGAGWVKLEVLGDKKTLLPDPVGTIEATKELVKEGFTVLAYSSDDPRSAVRIKEAGAASVMPAGSPIGSGQGVLNPLNISLCLELAANQHLLLGVSRPKAGISGVVDGTVTDIREAVSPTSVPNLGLIAGTGAILGAANISHNDKKRLIRRFRDLDSIVILDVGAGVNFNALDFFLLGPQKILVTTPQVTSVHDAYSFLKGAVLRMLRQEASRAIEKALLEPALLSAEATNVRTLLQNLAEQKPEFAERVYKRLGQFGLHIVGNQVTDARHVGVLRSISKMFRDYLGIEAPVFGWLRTSSRIHDSVNERRPLMMGAANEETRVLRQMAEALLAEEATIQGDPFDFAFEETTGTGHRALG